MWDKNIIFGGVLQFTKTNQNNLLAKNWGCLKVVYRIGTSDNCSPHIISWCLSGAVQELKQTHTMLGGVM